MQLFVQFFARGLEANERLKLERLEVCIREFGDGLVKFTRALLKMTCVCVVSVIGGVAKTGKVMTNILNALRRVNGVTNCRNNLAEPG